MGEVWSRYCPWICLEEQHKTTGNLGQESWYCENIANSSLEQYQNIIKLDMVVVVVAAAAMVLAVVAAVVDAISMNEWINKYVLYIIFPYC